MTKSPELLRQVGEACFGHHWVAPMAKALEVNPRRIRQWMADPDSPSRRPIPDGIWKELRPMIDTAQEELEIVSEILCELFIKKKNG